MGKSDHVSAQLETSGPGVQEDVEQARTKRVGKKNDDH